MAGLRIDSLRKPAGVHRRQSERLPDPDLYRLGCVAGYVQRVLQLSPVSSPKTRQFHCKLEMGSNLLHPKLRVTQ